MSQSMFSTRMNASTSPVRLVFKAQQQWSLWKRKVVSPNSNDCSFLESHTACKVCLHFVLLYSVLK